MPAHDDHNPPGLARQLLSILLLPFVVTVLVPATLLRSPDSSMSWWPPRSPLELPARVTGAILLLGGLALFTTCLTLFARVGRGTLAPWDPTRHLIAVGPYRYVRNPMITGVAAILAGEALLTGSWLIASWLVLFIVVNHLFFLCVEEPGLARRFGERYLEYARHVPRWIPRRRPWRGPGSPRT